MYDKIPSSIEEKEKCVFRILQNLIDLKEIFVETILIMCKWFVKIIILILLPKSCLK